MQRRAPHWIKEKTPGGEWFSPARFKMKRGWHGGLQVRCSVFCRKQNNAWGNEVRSGRVPLVRLLKPRKFACRPQPRWRKSPLHCGDRLLPTSHDARKMGFLIFRFISFKIVASLWQVRSKMSGKRMKMRLGVLPRTQHEAVISRGCGIGYAKTTALNIYVAFQLCINWMTERASA